MADRSTIAIHVSRGRGRYGQVFAYIRPIEAVDNRSRRCEVSKIDDMILKYYTPMNYYQINGKTFGSNSPENALKEYRRICAIEEIKTDFEVTLLIKP